jgi:hypothetical protein
MFKTVKAQKLITKVRQLSDMEQSQFVTDEEICSYLNDSREMLYSYFLTGNCDLGIFAKTIEIPPADGKYLAPYDIYKVIAVINTYGRVMLPSASMLVKHLKGDEYLFEEGYIHTLRPTEPLTLRYLPTPTLIPLDAPEPVETEEGEEPLDPEEFMVSDFELQLLPLEEKYLTLDSAITVMKKGENPTTDLERDRDTVYKRLQSSLLKNLSGANHRVIIRRRHR